MRISHLLATGILAAMAGTAFAQVGARPQIYSDVVPPDRGTSEIGLSLDWRLNSPSATTLDARFMPYLNRQVQVGGGLTYMHSSGFSGGFVEARANYNFVPNATEDFATNRTVPYAGVGFGVSFGDASGTAYGVQGGVKHFLTNDVSVFAELRYRHFSDSTNFLAGGSNRNDTRLLLGINTYLRGM